MSIIEERIRSLALAFDSIKFKFNGKAIKLKFADYFGYRRYFQYGKSYL